MHWLLFIHKILFSSTYFEPQVLILRRIQLYTCSNGTVALYESSWSPVSTQLEWELTEGGRLLVGVLRHPPTTFPLQSVLTQAMYRQAIRNFHRVWQYHTLHVYNCILLKMSTWGSKHVEENSILWINNNQCIKLVINIQSIQDARSEKHQATKFHKNPPVGIEIFPCGQTDWRDEANSHFSQLCERA